MKYVVTSFNICIVEKIQNRSLHHTLNQKYGCDISALAVQENDRYETHDNEKQSLATVKCNFPTRFEHTISAQTTILRCVENYNNLGYYETRMDQGRPILRAGGANSQFLLLLAPKKVPGRALQIYRSSTPSHRTSWKSRSHFFVQYRKRTSSQAQDFARGFSFYQSFTFFRTIDFSEEWFFDISGFATTHNTSTWGT